MRRVRIVAVAVAALCALVAAGGAAAAGPAVSWLSTGDSYAAGVGAGTRMSGSGELSPARCVQSPLAFGPRAASLLRAQRDWTIQSEAFTACIGFVATDFFNALNRDGERINMSQLEWTREQAPGQDRFDVVTISYGGNDVGFADVLSDCASPPDSWKTVLEAGRDQCDLSEHAMRDRVDALVAGRPYDARGHGASAGFGPAKSRISLSAFYSLIAKRILTPRGVLVVAGYPRLIAPSSTWPGWRGDRCNLISRRDADTLGRVSVYFDEAMRRAVDDARSESGRDIQYLSRFDLFERDGRHHGACTSGVEWMNGLTVSFEHSFHPNRLGYSATAKELIALLEPRFPQPESPVPTSPSEPEAPIDTGPSYEDGEDFSDDCIVAWPTAPLYSSDSVTLRMSCVHVPGQFLFTDVLFPNAELPITPSTGRVRVTGRVYGIADSGQGFRVLQVIADTIGPWRA